MGSAGELWEALNELVGEGIRHTKAWPGAPNALSGRMKRLAPALRGIGIEYGDARLSGGERKRAKRLTKYNAAKDRPYRPDRPETGESPAKRGNRSGTMILKRPYREKALQTSTFGTIRTVGTMICRQILNCLNSSASRLPGTGGRPKSARGKAFPSGSSSP